MIPALTRTGTKVTDVFETVRPHMEFTVNNILSHINTVFVLRTRSQQQTSQAMNPNESSETSVTEAPSILSTDGSVTPTSISSFMTASSVTSEHSNDNRLRLKGQMVHIPANDLVLFLCSPSVLNLDDLNRKGLYLSDIPLHDATRDLVLLSEQFEAEYNLTKNLEILTDRLQHTYRELEEEKQKTDRLLYSVLPPSVANELR